MYSVGLVKSLSNGIDSLPSLVLPSITDHLIDLEIRSSWLLFLVVYLSSLLGSLSSSTLDLYLVSLLFF